MALTDIAKQLKETFQGEGFEVAGNIQEELNKFRAMYGEAESIRIGEMDYIVINQVYKSEEYADIPEGISPLFYNSIHNNYAIIDAETSSTLIDEVYSRVTYMQRTYKTEALPSERDLIRKLSWLIGDKRDEKNEEIHASIDEGNVKSNKANIFQCHLIQDTGVSATPDTYSFMLKGGDIKEISEDVMRQIRHTGEVKLLSDREELEENRGAIQKAVFDKYISSEMDIQNINVKSIFEITMSFLNVHLMYTDSARRTSSFHTAFLASEGDEFDSLNSNIHVCDCCGHDLVDIKDPSKIFKIHTNVDAIDEGLTSGNNLVFATGCEDCLEQCPECGSWHFNYSKLMGSNIYSKVKLAPGRQFIKGLRSLNGINYCPCREGIEWMYDEKSGIDNEHDVIPMEKIAAINYAEETIATYYDYQKLFNEKKRKEGKDINNQREFVKGVMSEFKRSIAQKFDIDIEEVKITSQDRCKICMVCGGRFYKEMQSYIDENSDEFRCSVCEEMDREKLRTLTRVDGVVFMRKGKGSKQVINKYIITKLGFLKKIPNRTALTESLEEDAIISMDEQNSSFNEEDGIAMDINFDIAADINDDVNNSIDNDNADVAME